MNTNYKLPVEIVLKETHDGRADIVTRHHNVSIIQTAEGLIVDVYSKGNLLTTECYWDDDVAERCECGDIICPDCGGCECNCDEVDND